MQMTIEVPDNLPQEIFLKRIKEVELELIKKEKALSAKGDISKTLKDNDDPWSNPDIDIPSVDTGREDGSINHDHYIYGTAKR